MKIAVSLPDDLFTGAEKLAKRLKITRSNLYAQALADYLSRHGPDEVTEALDRVWAQLATQDESELATSASRQVLEQTQW